MPNLTKYFIYIARCNDGSLYTGYTIDIKKREQQHNEGKGASYTRMRLPVKIVYHEELQTRSAAMKRECQIKRLTKKEKESLIRWLQ